MASFDDTDLRSVKDQLDVLSTVGPLLAELEFDFDKGVRMIEDHIVQYEWEQEAHRKNLEFVTKLSRAPEMDYTVIQGFDETNLRDEIVIAGKPLRAFIPSGPKRFLYLHRKSVF